MTRRLLCTAMILFAGGLLPARGADESEPDECRLPQPLEKITCDFGPLKQHFQVIEAKHHPKDAFTVGGRIVAEETVAWTLEAKAPLKGSDVWKLLHPNPRPSPTLKVRFVKTVDGQEVPADARDKGYSLAHEGRWIDIRRAPDLAKGDRIQVWVHLGKEGTAGLLERQAARMLVVAK